ncbi:DUF5675 family protein [Bacteroides uniformis]|jgi:hypothetical protein|uniref:DUF5675 family protein n=1 Tax=Bacteroides uniformis TaxID=820 RepID=UPI003F24A1CB
MKLLLKRKFKGPDYTIGDLFIDGKFFCNTLEDTVRILPLLCFNTAQGVKCRCKEKEYGRTAIPAGCYKVSMTRSPRFKRVLPYLHDVPHFLGVLIHPGNDAEDTEGCILVGKNSVKGKVLESRATSDKLNEILSREKEITITIE